MLSHVKPSSLAEKRLRQLYRQLNIADQETLLRFAEFLAQSNSVQLSEPPAIFPTPESIERPGQESVVKAIKRLRATYPMIDPERLLNETSQLMSAHVIHGKAAELVINELEAVFQQHYLRLKAEFEQQQAPVIIN